MVGDFPPAFGTMSAHSEKNVEHQKESEDAGLNSAQASLVQVSDLSVDIQNGSKTLRILDQLSFEIEAGCSTAIVGRSGSGKTTLLSVLAGLSRNYIGQIALQGRNLRHFNDAKLAALRAQKIGFIFQSYSLIPQLSALENVALAARYGNVPHRIAKQKSLKLLQSVGLANKQDLLPRKLSGGEQQRVAIARALINDPPIIMADEPTGALDEATGEKIKSMLIDHVKQADCALIMVTHDASVAAACDRTITLVGGQISTDTRSGNVS